MNIIKITQQIEKLKANKNAIDAFISILYFMPNVPLKALLDKPGAIFVADSEAAGDVLGRLQAEGLVSVDANDFIRLSIEFDDICEFLPPPSYLQNKKLGETFIGCVFSALEKSDEALCEIWSQALKRTCEMLVRNPESKIDPDLPRFYSRARLACELLGEDDQAQFWEGKLFEYHGVNRKQR